MPLDWLFGSKKKPEPEPTLPAADNSNANSDEFVLLENDQPPANRGSVGAMYPHLPYALSSAGTPVSTDANSSPHEVIPTITPNFLSGVPFKLIATDTFEGIDSATAHHLRASQFISYVTESITSDRFSYDFQVEKSVLHEAGCRDLG